MALSYTSILFYASVFAIPSFFLMTWDRNGAFVINVKAKISKTT